MTTYQLPTKAELRSATGVVKAVTRTMMAVRHHELPWWVSKDSIWAALAALAADEAGTLAARLREVGEHNADVVANSRRLQRAVMALHNQTGNDPATVERRMAYRQLVDRLVRQIGEA